MMFKEREEIDPFFFDSEAEKDYQYSVCPECFEDPNENGDEMNEIYSS